LRGDEDAAKRPDVVCGADGRIGPGDVAKDIRDGVTAGHPHPGVREDDTEEREFAFVDVDEGV